MSPRSLAVAATLVTGLTALAEPPALVVRTDQPGHAVPRSLYGVFFEEINHAGEGGLYAELVRNRAFEEPRSGEIIPGWTLRASGVKGTLRTTREAPAGAASGASLEVEIDAGGTAAVVNEGYWGIPLRRGETYRLRLDARRSPELAGECTAALEAADGSLHAAKKIDGVGERWGRFECELVAPVDDGAARLAITVPERSGRAGKFWLDTVSLVPAHTWKDRRFGLRRDLGTMVEHLRPAFVRFPGGCYVEGGDFLKDAFRWPATVGDIADRPGHANATWGYWSTDGLGYHEYLQWCEDLSADAMYVFNCGLSHKDVVPLADLGPWIQEALDAIEYALGPADSKFGAMRAANGHAAPFPLKYVEIGNENGLWSGVGGTREVYTERYAKFYDAIKARFPQVITIANTRVSAPMEMVDDHYYNSPRWFWDNAGLYDKADRSGPRVYVGEYAVTAGCGTGNLAAALGEAAFMTGLERNSDLVTMSSYAPMFVHARDRRWNPDMIVFDGSRAYGTPSYHVQAMFAASRPDTLLPVDLPAIAAEPVMATGSIGLGTWNTSAEFKDIVVEREGKVVYASDFSAGAPGWIPIAGEWKAQDDAFRQTAIGEKHAALLDLPALKNESDYTLRLKARRISGAEGFLILFRTRDAEHFTWWNIGGWNNSQHAIEQDDGGERSEIGRHVNGSVETGRWYDVRIELAGPNVRCLLDGAPVFQETQRASPRLAATAGRVDRSGEIILKVVNGGPSPLPLGVDLRAAGAGQASVTATVLTSGAAGDENSFEHPDAIVPTQSRFGVRLPVFEHVFPGRSVTVLRILPAR